MKKINFQFHITKEELINFFKVELLNTYFEMYLIKDGINFESKKINSDNICYEDILFNEYNIIAISINKTDLVFNSYNDFLKKNENLIIFWLGKKSNLFLKESIINGLFSDEEILKIWSLFIKKLKKQLRKGCWIKNTMNGEKSYYKNQMYSTGAYNLFKDNIKMLPIAGWTEYIFEE
jgi:hypothetical protein